jgi:hypothetical protein
LNIRYLSEEPFPVDRAERGRKTTGPMVTAHAARRTGFFVALAVLSTSQFVAVAHATPVPNLVLTCSAENAIGQAQSACHGTWAYRIPTDPLIVSSGSSYVWRVLGDLIGADTVLVCTLPVEPGQYSSCRDASGVRRTALVRKDSIMAGGSVTVSKTGGDYTDPMTAAQNAFAGDAWCVAPQWPDSPCVMGVEEGIFILSKTLILPEGLAVSGNGKGDTMLIADIGVETAVSSFVNVRISDLTIINNQPGDPRTIGLKIERSQSAGKQVQLNSVAIHVAGAAQNVGILRGDSVEVLDSEITAVGPDSIGMADDAPDNGTHLWVERSHVSAETAFHEGQPVPGVAMRLIDSRISGDIFFNAESPFEIIRTAVIGNVEATNDFVRAVVSDSSIKGNVDFFPDSPVGGPSSISMSNTSIEGNLSSGSSATFDGLRILGQFVLHRTRASVHGSYLIDPASIAPVLSLRGGANVELEQTFVQGAQALAVEADSRLAAASSVLAGPISASGTAVLSCTDTYGADYELLTALCQPQPAP